MTTIRSRSSTGGLFARWRRKACSNSRLRQPPSERNRGRSDVRKGEVPPFGRLVANSVVLERGEDVAGAVAAAAIGADLFAVVGLDAHQLSAAGAVLHRAVADLDLVTDVKAICFPAE